MQGQCYPDTRPFVRRARSPSGPAWNIDEAWDKSNDAGVPSLKHLAMKKTISDQRNLTPQLFVNVPWHIASYLWDYLGSRQRTLHMWKLFATAYPAEFRQVSPYRKIKITGPRVSLRVCLAMAKGDHLIWRVLLTLGVSLAQVPELVEISEIRNIVALELIIPTNFEPVFEDMETPVATLSDRILRTWSELAQTGAAFSHLRVLVLQRQTELSQVALRYLKQFPSLQFVVAYKCPGLASVFPGGVGEVNGWRVAEARELPPETLYEYYQMKSSIDHEPSELEKSPILDFQIGPRTNPISQTSEPHSALYLQRTEGPARVDPEPNTKKRKGAQAPEGPSQSPSRSRRAVMKARRAKDLGDVLKDFL